jgi:hypothetical protein
MGFDNVRTSAHLVAFLVIASPFLLKADAATTTTLTISAAGTPLGSNASVPTGTVVTLTAAVSAGSTAPTAGVVNFCDATALSCTDVHLIGTAQLTSAGTATLIFSPSPGSHSYKAVFAGTPNAATSWTASSSGSVTLTVSGLYPSVTTIIQQSSPGPLSALVGSVSLNAPTGTVSFVDASDSNAVLASSTLSAATIGLQFLPPSIDGTGKQGESFHGGPPGYSVIVGDLNRDGHQDLVVLQSAGCETDVCWDEGATAFLGDGTGHLTQGSFLDLGPSGGLSSFATGDLNGDGILDLAFGDGNALTVALGNGDGTFAAKPAIATGGEADFLVAGDFNGDGILDLASLNVAADAVALLVGKGDGTFTPSSAAMSVAGANPLSMVAADFNGDGKLDLAIVNNSTSNSITILLGNGNGSFSPAAAAASDGQPVAAASGDFNGDGIADLVIANANQTATILLGKGDGTFTEAPGSPLTTGSAGYAPIGMFVGDFNGDGKLDIMIATTSNLTANLPQLPSVMLGNGDGTFFVIHPASAETVFNVDDFNGDGVVDIVGDGSVSLAVTETASASGAGVVVPPGTGANLVLAKYPGDSGNAASESGTLSVMAGQATPVVSLTASPNPAAANTPVILIAAVKGSGATPTGTVTFYDGSATLGSGSLNSSATATYTIAALAVGSHSVTASYTGDGNYYPVGVSQQPLIVTIAPLGTTAPAITLKTSSAAITTAQSFTASVTVGGPSGGATPSGIVTLASGSWTAQQSLASGSTAFSIPAGALNTGSDTLSASYSGDPTYAAAIATATVSVSQLLVVVSTPSSVAPGASAIATATISAGAGVSGTLNLTCSLTGSPAGAQSLPACSLSPSTITLQPAASGSAALTVTTTAGSASAQLPAGNLIGLAGGGLALAGSLFLKLPLRRRRWLRTLAFGCFLVTLGLIGCGTGGQKMTGSGTPATTAGTYSFTVSAADSANPAIASSTTVSVMVQ